MTWMIWGTPYDVGHLQIFQYQLRNQSISIPHWIQPCHSQPFVGSPPIAQVRRTGGIRSSPPTFSASGSCGPSWIHEDADVKSQPSKKGWCCRACLSGIAFSRRESKWSACVEYGKERNEKRKKVGLRAGFDAVADASSWKWPAFFLSLNCKTLDICSWGGFNDGAVPDMYTIMLCILKDT